MPPSFTEVDTNRCTFKKIFQVFVVDDIGRNTGWRRIEDVECVYKSVLRFHAQQAGDSIAAYTAAVAAAVKANSGRWKQRG